MKNKTILFCGAGMSGNMGAPALYRSMAQALAQSDNVKIRILSKHPQDDAAPCVQAGFEIIPFPTVRQILCGAPFFVFGSLFKALRLPYRRMAKGALRAYLTSDVLADISGITFSDDRPFSSLVINCLWLMPAIVTEIPIVKVSQSMGPFKKLYVRTAARFFLRRVHTVIARGQISAQHVRALLPDKAVYNLPDIAFLLPPDSDKAHKVLTELGITDDYTVLGPSIVVARSMGEGRYLDLMETLARRMYALSGLPILYLPHSRGHSKALGVDSISDDMTLCSALQDRLAEVPGAIFDGNDARVMKGLIASAKIAVGSRYHFMVAALGSGTPAMCIGWSHKYAEMMRLFDMEEFAVRYENATEDTALEKLDALWNGRETLRDELAGCLEGVQRRSRQNAELVLAAIPKKAENIAPKNGGRRS